MASIRDIFNLDFAAQIKLRPGGLSDNIALSGLAAGALSTSPLISGALPYGIVPTAGALATIAGGAWFGKRLTRVLKTRVMPSTLDHVSSTPPKLSMEEGMTLGYCMDSGKRVTIPWDDWMRHGGLLGASGVGKTVMGEWLMVQQIAAGGGLIWVNGKLDPDGLEFLRNACAWAGREEDLLVINPGNPELSNTYNPILFGDADEVADRLLSLIPSSENNAGADFYRQSSKQAMTTIIKAVQRTGKAYNFMDLNILLQNVRAITHLENTMPDGDDKKALMLFLDQYKAPDRQTKVHTVDIKRFKETFGGLAGRLHSFGTGNFGEITSDYSPDVNLYDAVRSNKIVYVMLPTMGKKETASNFGKMVVGDLRTTISWIQELPKHQRPWPPHLNFFDEAGAYITQAFSNMFEQARSAHMVLLPAVQTMANYEAVSEELREMVIGNNWQKIFFKLGTTASAEMAAELVGKTKRVAYSISASDGEGDQRAPSPTRHTTGMSQSVSIGYGEREEEDYIVTPDQFSKLDKGECIVLHGGDKNYHIKVPRISFDPQMLERLGEVRINRFKKDFCPGLDFFRDAERWLSNNEGN